SPVCALSLALLEGGEPVLGVSGLPFLGQRYWARAGGGAFVNGGPVPAVTGPRLLTDAVVALGDFATGPAAAGQNRLQLRLTGLLAARALRVPMLGSAAIDLAWLAAGRHYASVTLSNRPWDMAAGRPVSREAEHGHTTRPARRRSTSAGPRGGAPSLREWGSPASSR